MSLGVGLSMRSSRQGRGGESNTALFREEFYFCT